MEIKVTLAFECTSCTEPVRVKLKCSGPGLLTGGERRATVNVPCPSCGAITYVEFEPTGAVVAVTPVGQRRPILEPSIN
jgi:hypothetical protein